MPIHDFKGWAEKFLCDDVEIGEFWDRDSIEEFIGDLAELLIKAYELGKNPNVEKLDK